MLLLRLNLMTNYYSNHSDTTMQVMVREVWAHNLLEEFCLINQALTQYPIIAIDTEFPGTIHPPDKASLSDPFKSYNYMKLNVDNLEIIQLGLALSNSYGELANNGQGSYVWQFNFRDFDMSRDNFNPASIKLLEKHGIDFEKNRDFGIHSIDFARLFMSSVCVVGKSVPLTWVTFHGAYDFGFMIKLLTQNKLPSDIWAFFNFMGIFFGNRFYDMKSMMRLFKGWYGGLEKLASTLNVQRQVGNSHQAGSDSLLTIQTFRRFVEVVNERFSEDAIKIMVTYSCKLYGLEIKVA